MRVGLVTVAYHEPRFITRFLKHIPDWVDEKLVLVSTVPWQGKPESEPDHTAGLAELNGAYVVQHNWENEAEQRNAGQDWFYDMDWIIVLDPDEYLDDAGWATLKDFLEYAPGKAYVVEKQHTYWKRGFVISPAEEYKQIIAVRPGVRFIDKRVVNSAWDYAPVTLHHMSWARTDAEIAKKLAHYSHAHEFDGQAWIKRIWNNWQPNMENLHPLTPTALKKAVPAKLPPELERLNLWPK